MALNNLIALLDDASKDVFWKEVLEDIQDLLVTPLAALKSVL